MAGETLPAAIDHEVLKESAATSTNTPGSQSNDGDDARSRHSKDERDLEVQKDEVEDTEETKEAEGASSNVEYPTGFRLLAIVVALILSIFLVALDMTVRIHRSVMHQNPG